jgi:hypothetical protein
MAIFQTPPTFASVTEQLGDQTRFAPIWLRWFIDVAAWITTPKIPEQPPPTAAHPVTLATDPGLPGEIRYDSGYIYVCIAKNTWKRAAVSTF